MEDHNTYIYNTYSIWLSINCVTETLCLWSFYYENFKTSTWVFWNGHNRYCL